jgi:cell division protein FtsB
MRDILNKITNGRFKLPINRYIILFSVFAIWVIFFDNNSLLNRFELQGDINKLEKERGYYQDKIKKDNKKILELKTNKKNLEKFAREQYLMKKKNEDIYIIIKQDKE